MFKINLRLPSELSTGRCERLFRGKMVMTGIQFSRRNFLRTAGAVAGSSLLQTGYPLFGQSAATEAASMAADYTLKIATTPIELAPNRIVSITTHNGQFPGPLLRLKEGQRVTVDVHNETDVPEQLHSVLRSLRRTGLDHTAALMQRLRRPRTRSLSCGASTHHGERGNSRQGWSSWNPAWNGRRPARSATFSNELV